MTVTKKVPPFRTTVEVLDMPDFDLYLPTAQEIGLFLNSVGSENEERARAKIEPFIFGYDVTESMFKKLFYDTSSRKRGLIYDEKYFYTMFHQYNLDFCTFDAHFEFGIPDVPGGYIYTVDSMLQPLFDKHMMVLNERGQIDELIKRYWPKVPNCDLNSDFQPVNFGFVQILFVFLGIGIFFGSCILLCEILKDRTDKNKVRKFVPMDSPKRDNNIVVKRKPLTFK